MYMSCEGSWSYMITLMSECRATGTIRVSRCQNPTSWTRAALVSWCKETTPNRNTRWHRKAVALLHALIKSVWTPCYMASTHHMGTTWTFIVAPAYIDLFCRWPELFLCPIWPPNTVTQLCLQLFYMSKHGQMVYLGADVSEKHAPSHNVVYYLDVQLFTTCMAE